MTTQHTQMDASLPKLTVVVPVKNEADNLAPLIEEIHQALNTHLSFELIYVDDGSQDHSAQCFADLQQSYPHLTVLYHHRSYGQSRAIQTGIQHAHSEWIVTLDGDGQNHPADIPVLLGALLAIPDYTSNHAILGMREKRRDSRSKRWASYLANRVRSALLQDRTRDTGCGIKLFSRELFLSLPYFDHMHRFLPALMLRQGATICSHPVRHRPRQAGSSNYGLLDRLWVGMPDLFGVFWLIRRYPSPTRLLPSSDEQ